MRCRTAAVSENRARAGERDPRAEEVGRDRGQALRDSTLRGKPPRLTACGDGGIADGFERLAVSALTMSPEARETPPLSDRRKRLLRAHHVVDRDIALAKLRRP